MPFPQLGYDHVSRVDDYVNSSGGILHRFLSSTIVDIELIYNHNWIRLRSVKNTLGPKKLFMRTQVKKGSIRVRQLNRIAFEAIAAFC